MKYDWHGYGVKLVQAEALVEKSAISAKNKRFIFDFEKYLITTGLSKPRVLRYLEVLKTSALIMKKDFDLVTKDDVMSFVSFIEQKGLAEWTKQSYKVLFKRFFKWLKNCEEGYPPEVRWVKINIKKDRCSLPGDGDLLTETDVQKLLENANSLRDKAFVSCLWESGCRIGELATIRIKDVVFDEYGCIFNVTGKTGPRKIRVINSSPYLANWLSVHSGRDDRNNFFWVNYVGKDKGRIIQYASVRKMLFELFRKAGIKKRCNPHIFRHSRATFLANHLTEFQMNTYFGWVQGSDMPSTYVHLCGKDTDRALLKLNGVICEDDTDRVILAPQKCPRCSIINSHDNKFCYRCGAILDLKEAVLLEEQHKKVQTAREQMDLVMNMLMKDPDVIEVIRKKMEKITVPETQ